MSISPLALALIGAIGITAVISLWHNWQQAGEIESLRARHSRRATPLAVPAVPPREAGTSARRTPPRVENAAAAGGAPGAEGTWSSPQAPGAVPRPVNGRLLGTMPRRTVTRPVPVAHADTMWQASEPYLPELPQRPTGLFARKAEVAPTADAPPWETSTGVQAVVDPNEAVREEYIAGYLRDAAEITPGLMRDAMDDLRNLPVYNEAPQLEVAEAERLSRVMQP